MTETVSEGEVLRAELLHAVESIADLELAFEDKGWKRIGYTDDTFTDKGRQTARDVARTDQGLGRRCLWRRRSRASDCPASRTFGVN